MKRTLGTTLVALALSPGAAGADYLYDAFRAECGAKQADHYYSAADPVVATAPQEETEIGRIGSNLLVYGGFQFGKDRAGQVVEDDLRGHLYGIRLFREKSPRSNEWEFTDTDRGDLLASCGEADSACLFDAGQMLQDRTAPRKIFTATPGTPVKSTSPWEGDFTLPLGPLVSLEASEEGQDTLASLWKTYVALEPVAAALPDHGPANVCIDKCDKDKKHKEYGPGWSCPTAVPSSLCHPTARPDATQKLQSPEARQLRRMLEWLHGQHRPWKLGDVYHASAAVVEPPAQTAVVFK